MIYKRTDQPITAPLTLDLWKGGIYYGAFVSMTKTKSNGDHEPGAFRRGIMLRGQIWV